MTSLCTITKGCSGTLFKIGESKAERKYESLEGVIDWFPRNQFLDDAPEPEKDDPQVSLSVSSTGALSIAVRLGEAQYSLTKEIYVRLAERRIETIPYQQYVFKPSVDTTEFTGRDSQGKNLRIDEEAISAGRVFVKINGVQVQNFEASKFSITFDSPVRAPSTVEVTIFSEKNSVDRLITFSSNASIPQNQVTGAWSNVRWFDDPLSGQREYLFTCTELNQISRSSKLRIVEIFSANDSIPIENCRFVLASAPFSHVDRYDLFTVRLGNLNGDFLITATDDLLRQLFVPRSRVDNIFPQLRINPASLTVPNIIPPNTGAIPSSGEIKLLTSSVVNGPV